MTIYHVADKKIREAMDSLGMPTVFDLEDGDRFHNWYIHRGKVCISYFFTERVEPID